MFKLRAGIVKEFRLLLRDKVGLSLMFIMPVVLVVVITSLQNNTFKLVNDNQVRLIICNQDSGKLSDELILSIKKIGLFKIIPVKEVPADKDMNNLMSEHEALVTLFIPVHFSNELNQKISKTTQKALSDFGLPQDSSLNKKDELPDSLKLYYNPVLQESYRQSMKGALQSAILLTENKLMVKSLYAAINNKEMPADFEEQILKSGLALSEKTSDSNGQNRMPNATQHNIPAWTVFAMFFMVISLGGNIVKEKLSGSFIRLRVLPSSYALGLIAKQTIYLLVVLILVIVIFSIGVWIFPALGLPALNIPDDIGSLLLVSLICGWCAISYALCIGVFAKTQEQCSGFGAVSVVLLAAIGGIFVPSFAMPHSFHTLMKFSPLYWSLQSYYGIFLENSRLSEIFINILPLLASSLVLQAAAFIGLKRKHLI